MEFRSLILLTILIIPFAGISQQIIYSEPQKHNSDVIRIIGKTGDNFLVYKLVNSDHQLQVYDSQLKLKNKVTLDFIPGETFQINFINYTDNFLLIYQYNSKKLTYTRIARLDQNGRLIGKIVGIDSIQSGIYNGGEKYAVAASENKKYILLDRCLNGLRQGYLQVEQLIIGDDLKHRKPDVYFVPYSSADNLLSDLKIDNNGNVIFFTYARLAGANTNLTVYRSPFNSPDLEIKDAAVNDYILKYPRIEINNKNNLYHLTSFYQDPDSKNVEGFLSLVMRSDLSDYSSPLVYSFADSLPYNGAGNSRRIKSAFNNYELQKIIFREDGKVSVIAVLQKDKLITSSVSGIVMPIVAVGTSERNEPWERPYVYAPSFSQDAYFTNTTERYTSGEGNAVIFTLSRSNHILNIASMSNNPAKTPLLPYYQLMNLGEKVYFIYNNVEKHDKITLNDILLGANGNIISNSLFKNFDEGYTFMPELGKQIDKNTMIIPCEKNNNEVLALLHF